MTAVYRIDDPDVLVGALGGEGVYLGPTAVLDGLTAAQAEAKPSGLPHSIAEIVAHLCYWQESFNGCALAGFTGLPEHADEGWPAVPAGEWDTVRARYLASIDAAKRIAVASGSLNEPLLPPDVSIPLLARESRGSGVLHAAMHNAHHLGQVTTLRQLMGAWPPPGGSMTW